jgi:hypothetical protein
MCFGLCLIEGFFALIIAVFYSRYLKKEKLKKVEQSLLQHQQEEELIQAQI